MAERPQIDVMTSPHFRRAVSTDVIMRHVAYATLPIVGFAFFAFGASALLMVAVATASCVAMEHVVCRLSGRASTIGDFSAVVTGLLLGLTLPPSFPLWMAAVGGFASIALGKVLFGGLGYNIFNPALVGRAFLQAAFPAAITTWTPPFAAGRLTQLIPSTLAVPFMKAPSVAAYIERAAVDGWSGATPLNVEAGGPAPDSLALFAGMVSGSSGETCAVLILLCGAYLLAHKMMDWRIPAGVLGSVFVLSAVFHAVRPEAYPGPVFMLCSGGLMLGAVFMATDMVTSPTTPMGIWIFGALVGAVTVVIRLFGSLPEGVMYAILMGNAVTPLIETWTQPRVFGARRVAKIK